MTNVLLPGATIGIIGAGQLGKMLAQSAQKMGYRVAMYDPNPQSCGFAVANSYTVADFSDHDQLLAFVQSVDVVTYEFENIDGALLDRLAANSYLPQGTHLLLTAQDRLKEKNWLNAIGVPTVSFRGIYSKEDLSREDRGLLKTTRWGYDGKGQFLLDGQADWDAIEASLAKQPLILEAFCEFAYEVSVIVARDLQGTVKVFPPSVNEHIHGVLCTSLVTGDFDAAVLAKIVDQATVIAEAGHLVGVCGIEFFVTQDGDIVANELAPRPHNSGHYSMEGCNVSQFDQHILAITGRPIRDIYLWEDSLMVNILGQHMPQIEAVIEAFPEAMVHVYDKGEAKEQRKMGHFTLTQAGVSEVLRSDFLQAWRQLF